MRRSLLFTLAPILFILAAVYGHIEKVESQSGSGDDGIVEVDEEANANSVDEAEENNDEMEDFGDYVSENFDVNRFFFGEHFDDLNSFSRNWIKSMAKKDDIDDAISKYDGLWELELPKRPLWKNDLGLVLKSKAKHAAISSKLYRPFIFKSKPFVVQYEVTLQDGQECGGSYLKLLSKSADTDDLTKFNDKTPYTIMFGPDKCGNDIKLHFIFRHVNPINGTISEKHCRKSKERLEELFKDKMPHLYRLLIKPDNTYQISVDHKVVNEGSLLTDFTPPVNPPREIDDPTDEKPKDWDEREKIPDPDAKKPEDWDEDAPPKIPDPNAVKPDGWLDDEPEMIPDPSASKPEDWDISIDGEWEAPLIDNPACEKAVGCGEWSPLLITNPEYKGKWRPPMIENPNYQGKWSPRKILNPDFYEDLEPFKLTPIAAVGIELWSMSSDILFDNILITDEISLADEYASKTFDLKKKYLDKASKTWWGRLMRHMNYKPWWWALYFTYVAIPFGLYARFLRNAKKEEDEKIAAGRAKKTDEVTPDDEEKEAEQIKQTEAEIRESEISSLKSKKSDLEVNSKAGDTENNSEEEEEEQEDEENIENEENDTTEAKIENIDDSNLQPSPEGTRKRRTRSNKV
ncbi:calnexin isoform X2 [Condylostylus longicornis]|uniref:calnexin isoform X2 n=1 Tax=Condylostylus longicornis TaxID=2530218 RepID=UPI00244DE9DC|nr:calnexin isoform X2 [Condylostylus longicornis]